MAWSCSFRTRTRTDFLLWRFFDWILSTIDKLCPLITETFLFLLDRSKSFSMLFHLVSELLSSQLHFKLAAGILLFSSLVISHEHLPLFQHEIIDGLIPHKFNWSKILTVPRSMEHINILWRSLIQLINHAGFRFVGRKAFLIVGLHLLPDLWHSIPAFCQVVSRLYSSEVGQAFRVDIQWLLCIVRNPSAWVCERVTRRHFVYWVCACVSLFVR